jgi:hypothetical protein
MMYDKIVIPMLTLSLIFVFALMTLLGTEASAQGTTTTTSTPVTTPSAPNTGTGGDAPFNYFVLGVTGLITLGGVLYMLRSGRAQ